MKTLLLMSAYGTGMIILILLLRTFMLYKIPKRFLKILWLAAVLRLITPFWIDIEIKSNNYFANKTIPENFQNFLRLDDIRREIEIGKYSVSESQREINILLVIWCAGAALAFIYFAVGYIRAIKKIGGSEAFWSAKMQEFIRSFSLKRNVKLKMNRHIKSPLTYGIIRPIIILPENIRAFDERQIKAVLAHEMFHIKGFDILIKSIAVIAVCLHWFNPFAWIMLEFLNRDIELSCDEAVLSEFSIEREEYALTLIKFKEKQFSTQAYNFFARNVMKERIEAVMKVRKTTFSAAFIGAAVVSTLSFVFAVKAYDGNDISADMLAESRENYNETKIIEIESQPEAVTESSAEDKSGNDITLPNTIEALPQEEYVTGADAEALLSEISGGAYTAPLKDMSAITYYGAFEIKADKGEDIYAMYDGTVVYSGYDYRFGNAMIMECDGNNILYAGCDDITVKTGDTVSAGDIVGHTGESGFSAYPRLLIYRLTA